MTQPSMWSKTQLYKQMELEGWQPGTVDGKFIHKRTGKSIDMMRRDRFGALWIQYAKAIITPSPF